LQQNFPGIKIFKAPEPPWAYRRIVLKYRVADKHLTEKALFQAIRLSQEKYCSVAVTVRGMAEIVTEIEIVDSGSSKKVK
jgi:putative redox protein